MRILKRFIAILIFSVSFGAVGAAAQTNEFTYQGKLSDSATTQPNYDFEFRLCASETDCTTPLQTKQRLGVSVTNGIFTVGLDFDQTHFTGADRFLEISVRLNSGEVWRQLLPRQQITSAPYAIKSSDSAQLGGTAANQFVQTTDTRLSDERNPLPNSANYIQNATTPQAANFDISGNGTASIFNATNSFDINGQRVLGIGGIQSLYAGIGAGALDQSIGNSFFGFNAGLSNQTGERNSFFGNQTGIANFSGSRNSFFGSASGSFNTEQVNNTFIGASAGRNNGFSDTAVVANSNTFVGFAAGFTNKTGSGITILGANADVVFSNLINATAIGANSGVTQSNSLVLGSINGISNATADTNVGIGITAPQTKLHVSGTGIVRARVNSDSNGGLALTLNNQPGWSVATVSGGQFQIYNDALGANAIWINSANNRVGIGTIAPDQLLSVNGNASKSVGGGAWAVFSDERLKNINGSFTRGLVDLMRLNPIRFEYKPDNALGLRGAGEAIGFSAQEVERVLPEAVSRSANGYLQINNDPILWTMLNAVKQQQAQIGGQREQIQEQQKQIENQQRQNDALKKLVCEMKPEAEICKEK